MVNLGDFQHQREVTGVLRLAPDRLHDDLVIQSIAFGRFDFNTSLFSEYFEDLMCRFDDDFGFCAIHGCVARDVDDRRYIGTNRENFRGLV